MATEAVKKVAVMMSTYNGELYIEEQIDSILRQTGVEVFLYIRDDGSTDGTLRILQNYSTRDNVRVTPSEHNGIGISFMKLLWSLPAEHDYYAFSDQDDIWESDKLVTAVNRLSSETGCVLYASNLECVDADNNSIGLQFEPGMVFDEALLSVICRGVYYGCTQVFSKALFLILQDKRPSERQLRERLHDNWVAVSAAATGRIFYDPEAHIRYRRHENNYTKLNPDTSEIWASRFLKLVHRDKRNPRSRTAREVVRQYPESVENDKDRDLICFLANPRKLTNRIALIKHREKFKSFSAESDAWFIFKVLAGLI